MKPREIKSALAPAKRPDAAAPEALLALCREEYKSHRRLRRAGKWELVRSQLKFMALPVWLLQGTVLILICLGSSPARPPRPGS